MGFTAAVDRMVTEVVAENWTARPSGRGVLMRVRYLCRSLTLLIEMKGHVGGGLRLPGAFKAYRGSITDCRFTQVLHVSIRKNLCRTAP